MSKLVKMIKELSGREVDTGSYLKEKAVEDLANRYNVPKEKQHIWGGPSTGDLKDVIIGGYGDSNSFYGAGPTRLVPSAAYDLRLFAVKKNVDLIKLFGPTFALNEMVSKIKNHSSYDNRFNNSSHIEDDHLVLGSSHIPKTEVRFYGIVTNVHKRGFRYTGDLTLSVIKNMGYGNRYPMMASTLSALADRHVPEGGLAIAGNSLQNEVLRSKTQLDCFANTFRMNPDYKIWMLMVDNI